MTETPAVHYAYFRHKGRRRWHRVAEGTMEECWAILLGEPTFDDGDKMVSARGDLAPGGADEEIVGNGPAQGGA